MGVLCQACFFVRTGVRKRERGTYCTVRGKEWICAAIGARILLVFTVSQLVKREGG